MNILMMIGVSMLVKYLMSSPDQENAGKSAVAKNATSSTHQTPYESGYASGAKMYEDDDVDMSIGLVQEPTKDTRDISQIITEEFDDGKTHVKVLFCNS